MNKPLAAWVVDPANLTPYYSLALCGGLAQAGVAVRFVTSKFHYDEGTLATPPNVAVDYEYLNQCQALQTRFGSATRKLTRAALYPLGHLRLFKRARREHPDIVHLQWSRMPRLDRRLIDRLQSGSIRVVHTVHDVEPLYRGSGGRSALGGVYAACDGLVVHTRANADELARRYPEIDPARVHVIPHGPLQAETAPPGADQAMARRLLGIAEDVPVALFFGTIKPYKGLDILLASLPEVAKSVGKLCLLIAGKPGGPADVPDLAPLRRLGIDVRTEFGFIANSEVWKYYLAADVMVLPYRNITQSGVLLSGLAFGRAAIVTRVGGLPEIVEAGNLGWVTPPEDATTLTAALVNALSDRNRLAAMGVHAAQFVEHEYSWRKIGRETLRLYNALLAGRP